MNSIYINFGQYVEKMKMDNQALVKYLDEIFFRMTKLSNNKMNFYKFIKFMNLSTFIGKKIFKIFDKSNSGNINNIEFRNGILDIYSIDYYTLTRIYFNILDFTNEEKIYKLNLRIFLYHLKTSCDTIIMKESIFNIIELMFNNKEYITYNEFLDIVEEECSDILFIIFIFLYEKQPFTNNIVKYISFSDKSYEKKYSNMDFISNTNNTVNEKKKDTRTSSTIKRHILIIPTKNIIVFTSDSIYKKILKFTINLNNYNSEDDYFEISNEISSNFYVRQIPSSLKFKIFDKSELIYKKKIFNTNENYKIEDFSTEVIKKNSSFYVKESKDSSRLSNISNLSQSKKTDLLQYSKLTSVNSFYSVKRDDDEFGNYVYRKIILKNNQMAFEKTWLSVIKMHLFYTKGNIKKVHHLSISEVLNNRPEEEYVKEKKIYRFGLKIFGKIKTFYCKKEQECIQWIEYLKRKINQRDVFSFYKFIEKIQSYEGGIDYFKATNNNQNYLIKRVKKEDNEDFNLLIKNEIDIMKACKDNTIISYIDSFQDSLYWFIITEYISGRDINNFFIENKDKINMDKKILIAYELGKAINYLHEIGVMHRNLNTETIWMNTSNFLYSVPKIVDFRFSVVLGYNEMTSGKYGHNLFRAPEVSICTYYNISVDVWNYGSLMYFIFSGYPIFYQIKDKIERMEAILYRDINFPDKIWTSKYDTIKNLLIDCLKRDPENRYSSGNIIRHPMFDKFYIFTS